MGTLRKHSYNVKLLAGMMSAAFSGSAAGLNIKNKHQPPCSSCFILQGSGSSCFIVQVSGSSCFIVQVSGSSCFILQGSGSLVFSSLSSLTNTIFTAADLSSDDTPPDIPACLKTNENITCIY